MLNKGALTATPPNDRSKGLNSLFILSDAEGNKSPLNVICTPLSVLVMSTFSLRIFFSKISEVSVNSLLISCSIIIEYCYYC